MKHKAQTVQVSSLIGRYTRIVKHPRRTGKVGVVKDLFWRKDEPWVVIQLPSGNRMAVAVSWTDLVRDITLTQKESPVLLPSGVIELAKFLQGLRSHRRQPTVGHKQKDR